MIPTAFAPFFTASVGAAGALIGLLFIAISIAPERTVGKSASPERAALAGNAFTALSNVFFVSLVALIPLPAFGPVLIALGITSCLATFRLAADLLHTPAEADGGATGKPAPRLTFFQVVRRLALVVVSLGIYGLELWQGVQITMSGGRPNVERVGAAAILLVSTYGVALARMWNLLGARRNSLLGWLNVLNDQDE